MSNASRIGESARLGEKQELRFVAELKAHSPEAWARLFLENHERLRRYAMLRLGSADEADDLSSTVFVRALDRIGSYKHSGKPIVAWLYGITRNLLRERQHAQVRAGRFTDGQGQLESREQPNEPDGSDEQMLELLDLKAAWIKLTPQQQEVVALLHLGGFRCKEVAAMLGKSQRAIYYLEARALSRLKLELQSGSGGQQI